MRVSKGTFLASLFLFSCGGIGLMVWMCLAISDINFTHASNTSSAPAKINKFDASFTLEADYHKAMNKIYWSSMDANMWEHNRRALVKSAYYELKQIRQWAPGYKSTMRILKEIEAKNVQSTEEER